MIDLDRLIQQANDLEPLPGTTTRLAALAADPDAGIRELVDLVSFDQALTARLLRFANSAAVGSREPVASVQGAIQRLGTGTVLTVAMGAAVKGRLMAAVPQYGIGEGGLWRHSIAAALAIEALVRIGRVSAPSAAFSAALLHDVGKLVLSRFLDPEVLAVLHEARTAGGLSALAAEVEVLSVHHAELGGLIAQHWKLPDAIVQGISKHHTADEHDDVARLVRLADLLAHHQHPVSDAPVSEDDLSAAAAPFRLTAPTLERVEQAIADDFDGRLARYA